MTSVTRILVGVRGVIEYGKGIFCPGNNKTQADPLIGGNNAFMAQEGVFGKRFVRYPGEFDEELLKSMAAATGGKYFRAVDEHIMGIEYYQAVTLDGTARVSSVFHKDPIG